MTNTALRTMRAGLLAALVLLACAAPAPADTGHPAPESRLLLTVSHGDTLSGAESGSLLLCDPPRGHRHAAEACAELDAADGRIQAIPAKDAHCPMVFAPVTAQAHGTWRGEPVEYIETFANSCLLAARTGSVFALDHA